MSGMFADCEKLTGAADLSKWDIPKVTDLSSMFSGAGAESGGFVLNFSNKTFNNSDGFSADNMFKNLTGTIIATSWTMNGDNNPISSSMPKVLFGSDEQCDENNDNCKVIQITDSKHLLVADSSVLGHLSKDKYKYYRDVHADIKPDDDSFPDTSDAKFKFSLPAIYDSTDVEACKKPDENANNNDKYDSVACAKAVLKKHFLGDFTKAIRATREGDRPKYPEITNIFTIWYYTKTDPNRSCTTDPKNKTLNCKWYTVNGKEGKGLDLLLKDAKSPVVPFNTLYYLEMLSKPVPLPHTGGQSAVMFTFLSIGLFSMFAVAGAFARRSA